MNTGHLIAFRAVTLAVSSSLLLSLPLAGCRSDNGTVSKAKTEAMKEVNDAKLDLMKTEAEARHKTAEARLSGDPANAQAASVEAQDEVAKARLKLEAEKMEAQEEIADAKAGAK